MSKSCLDMVGLRRSVNPCGSLPSTLGWSRADAEPQVSARILWGLREQTQAEAGEPDLPKAATRSRPRMNFWGVLTYSQPAIARNLSQVAVRSTAAFRSPFCTFSPNRHSQRDADCGLAKSASASTINIKQHLLQGHRKQRQYAAIEQAAFSHGSSVSRNVVEAVPTEATKSPLRIVHSSPA